jgi:polar amino acid transport system ATP-binding protein
MSEITNINTEASDSPVSIKTVLRLDDVRKSFGNTQVLRGISFDIHQHEVVALLGPSGSGKSTLMKCVNLLEQVDDGQIWLGNTDITDPRADQDKIRARIGVVFQQFNLFPHMSVLRNVTLAAIKVHHWSKDRAETRAMELLERIGMRDKASAYPDQLSGGQQQRVAIARSLVNEPEVLLLDEPLGALDLKLRKEMQLELKSMQQRLGITFIFVTHDQEEALTMSDTIVVMKDGTIQQIGDPKTIYDEPANAFVADFIGESNLLRGTMIHDELVEFAGTEFPCVDFGFGENTPVDVVVRPEDIMLVGEDVGQMVGTIKSVLFKGVHYEMMIDTGAYTFKVHSTTMQPQGSRVGLNIVPFNIHIMKRLEDTTPAAEVDAEC